MAHYSHSQTDRYERAERRHGHAGLILTGIALLMLAALAWVWTQGSTAETALPQNQAPAMAQAAPSANPPAPMKAAAATAAPAPVVAPMAAAVTEQAGADQPATITVPAALMPPSDAVAAAGDTRAAR